LVQTAAQLAAEISDPEVVQPLKLARIIPTRETSMSGVIITLRLKTAAGTEIRWGNDPKNETKKQRLWNLLDNMPVRSIPIDLSKE
jgi:hypothetical protein